MTRLALPAVHLGLAPRGQGDRFWQVHRGTIVTVDAVSGVLREGAEKQFVLLKGGTERLPISRQFFHLVRHAAKQSSKRRSSDAR